MDGELGESCRFRGRYKNVKHKNVFIISYYLLLTTSTLWLLAGALDTTYRLITKIKGQILVLVFERRSEEFLGSFIIFLLLLLLVKYYSPILSSLNTKERLQ